MYYLTLSSPWKLQSNGHKRTISELTPKAGHNFQHFVQYTKELKSYSEEKHMYNASFLQRCLYSYIVDTSRNMRTKITSKVMSAKFRARSTDKLDKNKNGPSTYPTKQTVCQSIDYWRHKHKCDERKIASNTIDNEDDFNNMTSNIEEDTRKVMKELQKECLETSEKDKDAKDAMQKYLQHTLQSLCIANNDTKNNNIKDFNEMIANHSATELWESITEKIQYCY